jgi:hypothetical protein
MTQTESKGNDAPHKPGRTFALDIDAITAHIVVAKGTLYFDRGALVSVIGVEVEAQLPVANIVLAVNPDVAKFDVWESHEDDFIARYGVEKYAFWSYRIVMKALPDAMNVVSASVSSGPMSRSASLMVSRNTPSG